MKSESITNLAKALSAAQAEMPVVPKNSTNPFLRNKFADLGTVIETSRPVLAKHKLSISQFPTSEGDRVGVTSILMHESGEWISETIAMLLAEEKGKSAAQVAGSIITYLRRYAWSAMLGLYADEDTDGHIPEKKPEPVKQERTEEEKKRLSQDAWARLIVEAKACGVGYEPLNPKMTSEEMKAAYLELAGRIKAQKASQRIPAPAGPDVGDGENLP